MLKRYHKNLQSIRQCAQVMDRAMQNTFPHFKGMLVEPDGTYSAGICTQYICSVIIANHADGSGHKIQII
jgi:hypothetical protein